MKRILLTFSVILAMAIQAKAYSWIRIGDPRGDWSTWSNGTIDKIDYKLVSQGMYFDVTMEVTFSAANYKPTIKSDSLEVQFGFNLPTGSTMYDAWLKVGEQWQQAYIMDRREATEIYEGIVKRRQDPMIIYKYYGDYYYLQIFPLNVKSNRTARISFLTPATPEAKNLILKLPALESYNYFNAMDVVKGISVLNINVSSDSKPTIAEIPEISPQQGSDKTWNFKISRSLNNGTLTLAIPNPNFGKPYFSVCGTGDSVFYQLAYKPSDFIPAEKTGRKFVFVIAHDTTRQNYYYYDYYYQQPAEVSFSGSIKGVKTFIEKNLTTSDSFNIVVSGITGDLVSNTWIAAKPSAINETFASLTSEKYKRYKLSSLLNPAAAFVKKTKDGEIILVSNTREGIYADSVARETIRFIKEANGMVPTIHVADYLYAYADAGYAWEQISFYASNQTLGEIARLSKGLFVKVNSQTAFNEGLQWMNQKLDGEIDFFEATPQFENGIAYANFDINPKQENSYYWFGSAEKQQASIGINDYKMSVGRLSTVSPASLNVKGLRAGKLFSMNVPLNAVANGVDCDLQRKIWVSSYIASMESGWMDVNAQNKVVETSVKNRVLSSYTSFLALEPGADSLLKNCTSCGEISQNTNSGSTGSRESNGIVSDAISVDKGGAYNTGSGNFVDGFQKGIQTACDTIFTIAYSKGYNEGIKDATGAIDGVPTSEILTAAPNPFSTYISLNIDLSNAESGNIKLVEIVDIMGKTIKTYTESNSTPRKTITWLGNTQNGSSVSSGNYFVVVTSSTKKYTYRITKLD